MINDGLNEFKGKRVLMLQGPVGPFFARFSADLTLVGAVVFKVNFNGGDWLFSKSNSFSRVFNFTDELAAWPDYFDGLLQQLNIDIVFLFGDCRPMHVAALAVIRQRGLEAGVFEEGYIRPDYITLESNGVNNYSSLPSDPEFYLSHPRSQIPTSKPLGSTYWSATKWGGLYFAAASLASLKFRRYKHHRRLGFGDFPSWMHSYWRKFVYAISERHTLPMLVTANSGNFYLVALQTRGDSQISVHSDFESMELFIEATVASFAQHAPQDTILALKHHPLDRGYSDYTRIVQSLIQKYQLEGRCYYIHDQHLPTLLLHARGVVVVNSTVGLSAVGEGVPVKVCGHSIYDIEGLTFQGTLSEFWGNAHMAIPNSELYQAFKSYLISHTQHLGSFYKRLPEISYQSGVIWTNHEVPAPHRNAQTHKRKRSLANAIHSQSNTP